MRCSRRARVHLQWLFGNGNLFEPAGPYGPGCHLHSWTLLRHDVHLSSVELLVSAWTMHKGDHAAAIDLKGVPGIGAEIVLTVDGEMRKTRLFRSHEQAELVGAIADTRTMFEGKGWA
jgi:hypothetical protein